jgi:hypothetical protein
MAIKGQTHAKRAREFALREKRELKKAKKEDRRNGIGLPEETGPDGEPILQPQPEPEEWVQ